MLVYRSKKMWRIMGQFNKCALFRLSTKSLVGKPVSGLVLRPGQYLAVVPASWSRHEDDRGKGLISSEPVAMPGYVAYRFQVGYDENDARSIVFRDDCGERVPLGYLWS